MEIQIKKNFLNVIITYHHFPRIFLALVYSPIINRHLTTGMLTFYTFPFIV